MSRDVQAAVVALVLGSGIVGLVTLNAPGSTWTPTTAPIVAPAP